MSDGEIEITCSICGGSWHGHPLGVRPVAHVAGLGGEADVCGICTTHPIGQLLAALMKSRPNRRGSDGPLAGHFEYLLPPAEAEQVTP